MPKDIFVPFIIYIFANAFSPGPNNILAFNNTSRYGLKKGKYLLLGNLCGEVLVMSFCALFTISLSKLIPKIMPFMKYAGALYIFYIAYKVVKNKPSKNYQDKPCGFLTGFLFQFINIRFSLYGLTTLSAFVLPYYSSSKTILAFAMLPAIAANSANWTWASCGVLFCRFFDKYSRVINTIMAAFLIYCALKLMII
ncbi:MAG: LysE family transporter [Lachnospiraceae bacterium]|nr:LysE family transporter [Lachnospiraceae bacterium]